MATTQERLDRYYLLEEQITTKGQAYTADGLQMTRADLPGVAEMIEKLEAKVKAETAAAAGGGRLAYGRPG